MLTTRKRIRYAPLALVFWLISLSACEEDVDPVIGTDLPFTLYGILTPQLDTQWVRVYPIEDVLVPTPNEKIDGIMTSVDQQTGRKVVWSDSLIRDRSGQFSHVFWAPFRADYGHTYAIEVVRSDNARTSVTTTVPDSSGLSIGAIPQGQPVAVPISLPGGIPRMLNIEVEYHVRFGTSTDISTVEERFFVDYNGFQVKQGDTWMVEINLTEDQRRIQQVLRDMRLYSDAYGVALINMRIRLTAGNEEWNPPGGKFDPDILVQPGMMDNVENGFGFIGAGYVLEKDFLPPEEDLFRAGFKELR